MTSLIDKCPSDEETLLALVEAAKEFAFSSGLVVRLREEIPFEYSVTFAPFTLVPSPWPRSSYDFLKQLQFDINVLYYRVAKDHAFLKKSLSSTCKSDEWTRNLWGIYERTRVSQQKVPSLAILRSDYMIGEDGEAKQIEVNTISSSFGGLSPTVEKLHKYVLEKLDIDPSNVPTNNGLDIARGLAAAWKTYGNTDAVICFIVEDTVYNAFDQRKIEISLINRCGVPANRIRRLRNKDLIDAKIDSKSRLFIGAIEVAVVYMRTWYEPHQMKSDEAWETREIFEKSRAIKCPNVAWHLAGCKKIQQELSRPGVLEQFCDDQTQVKRIRSVFAGLYALEEPGNAEMVLKDPERFVVKPQREGGGHNVYGKDIKNFMEDLAPDELAEYIVMDKVMTVTSPNYLIKQDKVTKTDVISELGIFGYVLGDCETLLENRIDCGWIHRAKNSRSKEGGVAAGYGHLSSPYLI